VHACDLDIDSLRTYVVEAWVRRSPKLRVYAESVPRRPAGEPSDQIQLNRLQLPRRRFSLSEMVHWRILASGDGRELMTDHP